MIQNQHQYQVTQNKLRDLEQGLVELLQIKDTLRPRQLRARKHGLERTIATLQQEIAEYDSLRQQQTPIKIASIKELPLALI